MAYVITAACAGPKEQPCIRVCPADAFVGRPAEPRPVIDPDLCIDCGLCASVCLVEAILPGEDLPQA
ncbi:MAG: indolepyruvate ferredoxin oxidoreductase subunit alpha [Meiothermus ruber]|uniref:Ferredoxin n=1 Tax=Meiothermus ruber TaxID=277 RepID=A0A7C3DE27_MEIRU|nr:4Fe-4S binding protein [Meiothermus ruber]